MRVLHRGCYYFLYQGRYGSSASALELNNDRDTTSYTTYQYSANKVEQLTMKIDYFVPSRNFGRNVTEYTAAGKILSEKGYMVPGTEVYSQVDYTYDAAGNLLKKISTSVSSPSQEERYFINATTGVTEKMEYYYDNKLRHITTYYYE